VSIGFQGCDPITDFRGGGLLSLSQLIYFCENYTERARNLNVRASHPTKGYGLAITGINLTVLLSKALNAGAMKKVKARKIIEFHFFSSISTTRQFAKSSSISPFRSVFCTLTFSGSAKIRKT
jgi:hypothetical protein